MTEQPYAAGLRMRNGLSRTVSCGLGMAPTIRSTGRPFWRTTIVGIERASKRCASAGFSSTLTLITFRRPAYSRDSSSRMGLTNRHGPHHGAQRSTTTETAAWASTSNVASVASTSQGSRSPHLPQVGTPLGLGRIRFRAPQFLQVSVDCGPMDWEALPAVCVTCG